MPVPVPVGLFLGPLNRPIIDRLHAFSSVLFKEGRSFKKHKEVRSALHRDYIRNNRLDVSWGKHYDWLFDNRQKADYRPLVRFDPEQVKEILEKSIDFVAEMKKIETS